MPSAKGVLSHFQQFLRPADLFRRGGNGIGQGIGDAQLLPLEQAQRVVGQHLHPLHRFQAADEICGPAQALLVIGEAGHQHMPDPERNAQIGNMPCHG